MDRRLGQVRPQLKFYDGETHRGMFAVPRNLRRALEEDRTVIDDSKPLSAY